MTPEEQKIAIAQVRGCTNSILKSTKDSKTYYAWFDPSGKLITHWDSENPTYLLPDYLSDLNAIHEVFMEKFRTYEERTRFYWNLLYACKGTYPQDVLNASASHWSEAILKTLNLWKK